MARPTFQYSSSKDATLVPAYPALLIRLTDPYPTNLYRPYKNPILLRYVEHMSNFFINIILYKRLNFNVIQTLLNK